MEYLRLPICGLYSEYTDSEKNNFQFNEQRLHTISHNKAIFF